MKEKILILNEIIENEGFPERPQNNPVHPIDNLNPCLNFNYVATPTTKRKSNMFYIVPDNFFGPILAWTDKTPPRQIGPAFDSKARAHEYAAINAIEIGPRLRPGYGKHSFTKEPMTAAEARK